MRPSWQMKRISVSKSPTFTGQVREVFHQATPTQGRHLAARLIRPLPACPIPEIARLGRTLRKWKDAHVAYFDTAGASNAPHQSQQRTPPKPATHPTKAINGHYRTRQTHRQRLPQPHQLPAPNAPHRRRPRCLHPHSTLKSPLTDDSLASVYSRTPLDDELQRAHHALDAAVDRLFGIDDPSTDQRERRLIQWYLKISR